MIFAHVVKNPKRSETEADLSYLRLFAMTLQTSSIGTSSSNGRALRALAELILDIAEPIVHQQQQQPPPPPLPPPSTAPSDLSGQQIPYTPAGHGQSFSISALPAMSERPSSAGLQDIEPGLSSTVSAAGSIFNFLFQPSTNVSPHIEGKRNTFLGLQLHTNGKFSQQSPSPFYPSVGNSGHAFSAPLNISDGLETLEGLDPVYNNPQTDCNSDHWYT